ncbi:CPBP family intramembrane metalloprotease [candidate division KSB1 bacterium]|nr:CPBP family intramembrane metalloprotease [candidate division KSB1 bacterium]
MNNFRRDIIPTRHIAIIFLVTFFMVMLIGVMLMRFLDQKFVLLAEVFIVIPAYVYVRYKHFSVKRVFRLNAISLRMGILSFFIAVSTIVITDEMDRTLRSFFPIPSWWQDAMKAVVEIQTIGDGIIIILAAVLLAGVAEEMIFRGLLQRSLEYERDPFLAVVLSAVFFALVHFNPWTALQITFLGLVLGYLSWKSKSIYPAVLLHALNNLVSIVVLNLDSADLSIYAGRIHVKYYWVLLAIFVLLFSLWGFNRESERFYHNGGFRNEDW